MSSSDSEDAAPQEMSSDSLLLMGWAEGKYWLRTPPQDGSPRETPASKASAQCEKIGIVQSNARCLLELLQHYDQNVYLGFCFWRKMLVLLSVDTVPAPTLELRPGLRFRVRPGAALEEGNLGDVTRIQSYLPRMLQQQVVGTGTRGPVLSRGDRLRTPNFETLLMSAVRNNQLDVVSTILTTFHIDLKTEKWSHSGSPLIWAIQAQHVGMVKLLIDLGDDVEYEDDGIERKRPLHYAIDQPDNETMVAIAELLLKKGADFEARLASTGTTPLMNLFSKPEVHAGMLEVLVKNGASLESKSRSGYPVLHILAAQPHAPKTFLQLATVVDHPDTLTSAMKGGDVNPQGGTILHVLVASLLGEKTFGVSRVGATVDQSSGAAEFLGAFIEKHQLNEDDDLGPSLIDQSNGLGRGPLEVAAMKPSRHVGVLEVLIDKGARLNKPGQNCALHDAALVGHAGAVELLLSRGADIEIQNPQGEQPLHCAATNGHTEVVALLLRKGAKIDAVDRRASTPLHSAIRTRHDPNNRRTIQNAEAIQLLIQESPFEALILEDIDGNTVLHKAASLARTDVVAQLLAKGMSPGFLSSKMFTPVHCVCNVWEQFGDSKVDTVKLLTEVAGGGGVVPELRDATDADGKTALHYAAASRDYFLVDHLLDDAGASPNCVDNQGRTPLHLCVVHPDMKVHNVAQLLVSKGADVLEMDNTGKTPLHCVAELEIVNGCIKVLLDKDRTPLEMMDLDGKKPRDLATESKVKKLLD